MKSYLLFSFAASQVAAVAITSKRYLEGASSINNLPADIYEETSQGLEALRLTLTEMYEPGAYIRIN